MSNTIVWFECCTVSSLRSGQPMSPARLHALFLVASFLKISNVKLEPSSSRPTIGRSQRMFSWPLLSAAPFMSCSRTVRDSRYTTTYRHHLVSTFCAFPFSNSVSWLLQFESDYNNTSSLAHCQLCVDGLSVCNSPFLYPQLVQHEE